MNVSGAFCASFGAALANVCETIEELEHVGSAVGCDSISVGSVIFDPLTDLLDLVVGAAFGVLVAFVDFFNRGVLSNFFDLAFAVGFVFGAISLLVDSADVDGSDACGISICCVGNISATSWH